MDFSLTWWYSCFLSPRFRTRHWKFLKEVNNWHYQVSTNKNTRIITANLNEMNGTQLSVNSIKSFFPALCGSPLPSENNMSYCGSVYQETPALARKTNIVRQISHMSGRRIKHIWIGLGRIKHLNRQQTEDQRTSKVLRHVRKVSASVGRTKRPRSIPGNFTI